MCLNETCSIVRAARLLFDTFAINNGLKQGVALSSLLFSVALECAFRRVQANQEGLKLNGTHQLLIYADGIIILGRSVHTIQKITEALTVACVEIGLKVCKC